MLRDILESKHGSSKSLEVTNLSKHDSMVVEGSNNSMCEREDNKLV